MENIIYTCLYVVMAIALYYGGKGLSTNNILKLFFNKYTMFAVVVFTLNEGLRWGRGLDYNAYYNSYQEIVRYNISTFEWLFTMLIRIFGYLNLSWQWFVAFMSLLLILSMVYFSSTFKSKSVYMLLIFAVESSEPENLMRWYMAFSFLLVALHFLLEEKYKYYILLSILAFLIHEASLFLPPIYLLIYLKKKNDAIFNPYIAIPLYFVITYLFSADFFLRIAEPIRYINAMFARFESYSQNMSYYYTGGYSGNYENLSITLSAYYSFLVYFGYRLLPVEDKKYAFVYNVFLLGYILLPFLRPVELFFRYDRLLIFFHVFVASYVCYYFFKKNYFKKESLILFCVILLALCRQEIYGRLIKDKYHTLYIWDSHGAEYLNIEEYYH